MARIKIVMNNGDGQPGFVHAWLLRAFLPGVIEAVPYVGGLFGLIDILFIFGDERRCIHDLMAGTKVVEA